MGRDAADACQAVGAEAFTTGRAVAFKTPSPSLHTAAHEAVHVLQQAQGVHLAGGVGHEGDPYEQQADAVADRVVAGESAADRLPAGGERPREGAVQRKATAGAIDRETALQVVSTVDEMLANAPFETTDIRDDGTAAPHDFTKDVPPEFVSLIREWQLILWRERKTEGGISVVLEHEMILVHLDMALVDMSPLLAVLERDASSSQVAADFRARTAKLRASLIQKDVGQAVSKAAVAAVAEGGESIESKTQDEQFRIAIDETLQIGRRAASVMQRLAGDKVRQLDAVFKEAVKNLAPIGQIKEFDSEVRSAQSAQAAIQHVSGFFNLLSAIYAVADPEERVRLWNTNAGKLGTIRSISNLAQVAGQLISGGVAVVGVASYAAAKVSGNAKLATTALSASGKTLGKIAFVLNVIGVIRGVLVLIDPSATAEEKAEAVVDIGAGGLGIASRLIPTFTSAGPAALSLVVNFYAMKAVLKKGVEAYAGLVQAGLNECYGDMKLYGGRINTYALELAISLDLMDLETDGSRKIALAETARAAKENLVDGVDGLRAYLKRAIDGAATRDPGSWGPLRRRFEPLAERPMDTDTLALGVAADFIQTIVSCFTKAEPIFVECAEWAMEQYG